MPFLLLRPVDITCFSSVFTAFMTAHVHALFTSCFLPLCTGFRILPFSLLKSSENKGAKFQTCRKMLLAANAGLCFGTVQMNK